MVNTGAVVAVTLQAADLGDTATVSGTVTEACEQFLELMDDAKTAEKIAAEPFEELVDDKGYHSNEVLVDMADGKLVVDESKVKKDKDGKPLPGAPEDDAGDESAPAVSAGESTDARSGAAPAKEPAR